MMLQVAQCRGEWSKGREWKRAVLGLKEMWSFDLTAEPSTSGEEKMALSLNSQSPAPAASPSGKGQQLQAEWAENR